MSELAATECERRLAALPKDSLLGAFARGVVRSAADGSFELRIEHGGSMPRRVFRGRCLPDGPGSRIVGRFRWSRGDRVMAIVGMAMVTAIGVNDLLSGAAWERVTAVVVWALAIALGMAVRIGGAHDEARLMELLRADLKARVQDA